MAKFRFSCHQVLTESRDQHVTVVYSFPAAQGEENPLKSTPNAMQATCDKISDSKYQTGKKNKGNKQIWQVSQHPSRSQTSEPLLPQTAVLDDPDTLDADDIPIIANEDDDDSDGSCVEILDGGSDADICNETELTRFSKMLQDAQKAALAKEKAKGNKRKKFDGHSASTVYRRKRVRDNLAAMGYLPVPMFMKQMKARKTEKHTTLTFEESEESSDDNVTIVSHVRSNEPSTSEGACHQFVRGPALSEGCCWVTHSTSEGARCQVAQGPAMSEGCC